MIYIAVSTDSALSHHGILGQKWGVRRYQNEDGTLTEAGKKRYLNSDGSLNNRYTKDKRKEAIKRYKYVAPSYTNKNLAQMKSTQIKNIEYDRQRMADARTPREKKAWKLVMEYDKRHMDYYQQIHDALHPKDYDPVKEWNMTDDLVSRLFRELEEDRARTAKEVRHLLPDEQVFT